MAHRSSGSVQETFTTTGAGNVTLAGAVAGFETFAAAGWANNDTFFGRSEAVDGNAVPTGDFEEALYTWTTGGTIVRTAIVKSSNGDAAVSWAAGTKRMFCIRPAMATAGTDTSPAQLTANTNDWSVLGTEVAVVRFSTDASRNITGLANGFPGRIAYLHNVGSNNAVLTDEDSNSSAANRFALSGNLTVYPDMLVPVQYDGTSSRWRSMMPSSQTIIDLTEDSAPDISADFAVFWDVSAGTTDRVLLRDLRNVLLGAGSASAGSWPLLPSGTLLTTAEAGAVERDSNTFYLTTDAGNRGTIGGWHWIRADATRTLPNDTNENAIFNSPTNGRLTLETGLYEFEAIIAINSMSATSGNALIDWLGAGTATAAAWLWAYFGKDGTNATVATVNGAVRATQDSAASINTAGTGTELCFWARGTFEITGAGTLIPSVDQVTAAAAVVQIGSFFKCRRIGSTSMVSVGQWD